MVKMAKLNKNCNLYDKDGNLIRKAPLKDYTIKELEELLDNWPKGIEYQKARYYATSLLMQMYQNPKTEEDKEYVAEVQKNLIEKLTKKAEEKSTEEQKQEALEEVEEELKKEDIPTIMDEYVDFEPVTEEQNDEGGA